MPERIPSDVGIGVPIRHGVEAGPTDRVPPAIPLRDSDRADSSPPPRRPGIHQIPPGVEERVGTAPLVPSGPVVMRLGVPAALPDVMIGRIVVQVVDQRVAVIVVDRTVGENIGLEPVEHIAAAPPAVDDHVIVRPGDGAIDQAEREVDSVRPAERVEALVVTGVHAEHVVAPRAGDVEVETDRDRSRCRFSRRRHRCCRCRWW